MVNPRDGLSVVRLGRLPYAEGLEIQERLRDAVQDGRAGATLLLLEHGPTVTAGRRSAGEEMPMGPDWYRARGIEVFETDRGGRVTYHGPGQLVGYPVMAVDDAIAHVRAIERAIIAALAPEGIAARSRAGEGPDYTGVWVEDRKIASIGIHLRRGISTHGFALNVNMAMDPWEWIVPCGLEAQMTSVALESAREPDTARLEDAVADAWAAELGMGATAREAAELEGILEASTTGAGPR